MAKNARPVIGVDMGAVAKPRATMEGRQKVRGEIIHGGLPCVKHTFFIPTTTARHLDEFKREKNLSLQQMMAVALDQYLMREGATFSFIPPDNGE